MTKVGIYKISHSVKNPCFETEEAACFDLRCHLDHVEKIKGYSKSNIVLEISKQKDESIIIEPGQRILIPTGLIFVIEKGYSLRIHPRSSMALKKGLTLCNAQGIIDSDYYHETFVALHNISMIKQKIFSGDRICQAEIVESNCNDKIEFEEITIPPRQKTSRKGGFGSTGES